MGKEKYFKARRTEFKERKKKKKETRKERIISFV